jgi:hypothetical protein
MKCAVVFMMMSSIGSAAAPATRLAVGDTLPTLRGEFLTGRPALLPQAASGRVALLLLGFTYDSRFRGGSLDQEVSSGIREQP